MTGRTTGTLLATGDVPPSEHARGAPALVAMRGGESRGRLETFSASLRAGRRMAPRRPGDTAGPGAVVGPGDLVVLQLPNARRDVNGDAERPLLGINGAPVRLVALADGGRVLADRRVSDSWPVERGAERVAVIGLGVADDSRPIAAAGLWGWHAGMQLPYIGWSTAIGSGCTVQQPRRGRSADIGNEATPAGCRAPSWRAG